MRPTNSGYTPNKPTIFNRNKAARAEFGQPEMYSRPPVAAPSRPATPVQGLYKGKAAGGQAGRPIDEGRTARPRPPASTSVIGLPIDSGQKKGKTAHPGGPYVPRNMKEYNRIGAAEKRKATLSIPSSTPGHGRKASPHRVQMVIVGQAKQQMDQPKPYDPWSFLSQPLSGKRKIRGRVPSWNHGKLTTGNNFRRI